MEVNTIKKEEVMSGAMPAAVNHTANEEELEYGTQDKSFNTTGFICWIGAVLAISATVFFWLLGNSVEQSLIDTKEKKDQVISEVYSPTYKEVEEKASAFKAATLKLSEITKNQYLFSEFLTAFYGQIAKNVTISNLAIGASGEISFNAETDSYRSAAEQQLVLTGWKINKQAVLTDVDISNVSVSVDENGVSSASFAVSAKINKSVKFATPAVDSTTTEGASIDISTNTDEENEGGLNAEE